MQKRGKNLRVPKFFLLACAALSTSLIMGFFHSRNYEEVTFRNPDAIEISGTLNRPQGKKPFPAMVLLHTCGGLGGHVTQWAEKLVREGYLALAVDSWGSRGKDDCTKRDSSLMVK
ncbi:MAG: dienelactone hydrolase family protein, partial [bacterium]